MTTHDQAGPILLDISERLVYLFGEPVDREQLPHGDAPWAHAEIEFEGGVSGKISLTVPRSLCREFAANMLGLDAEDLDEGPVPADALGELLNVVAGHVVRGLLGEGEDVRLSVPVYRDLPEGGHLDCINQAGADCYNLEGSPAILTLIRH